MLILFQQVFSLRSSLLGDMSSSAFNQSYGSTVDPARVIVIGACPACRVSFHVFFIKANYVNNLKNCEFPK